VLAEKAVLPPFGVCGGAAGATNRFWVRREGARVQPSPLPGKVSAFPLERGDVLVMESSGGGGFGDPLERDPARVAADVGEGYVTPDAAEAIYGVVLRAGKPVPAATVTRRTELRATRVRLRIVAGSGLDAVSGRVARLSADAITRLGVAPGAVVEFVNPRGAPLRAWVADRAAVPGADRASVAGSSVAGSLVAELAPIALAMLGVADGAEVEVRAVHSGALAASNRGSGAESG
jgi:N-methylhydantoinase B